jgi:hypothetical protein
MQTKKGLYVYLSSYIDEADSDAQPDMVHTLIPRSTGLQYVLRSLVPRIPALDVIDLTVAYPGIPPRGIPQDYYTLRSIFAARVAPPTVHIHVRRFRAATDIPFGDVSASDPQKIPVANGGPAIEVDVPEHERKTFENWLQARWREKDEKFEHYYATGRFAEKGQPEIILPLRVRSIKEYFDAFCFFAPVIVWRMFALLRRLF